MENPIPYNWKVVLLGDANVGKTTLLNRYVRNLLSNPRPTLGVEFLTKTFTLSNGKSAKLQFWDTAGQEKYRAIVSMHLKKVNGALIVFDLTDPKSFENVKFHLDLMRQYSEPNTVVLLVGNKLDLNDERKVPKEMVLDFSRKNNLEYEETSAHENLNVNESFDKLIETIKNVMEKTCKGPVEKDKNDYTDGAALKKSDREKQNGCC